MGVNEGKMWARFTLPDFRGEILLFTFLEVPVGSGNAHCCGYQASTEAWQTWQDVEEFYALLEHSWEADRARNLVWE